MSYDLSLRPAAGHAAPSIAELDAYFAARPGYAVESGFARYGNEHTGCSFRFSYGDQQRSYEDEGPIALTAVITGPATRALEIADEIEALVGAFKLVVDDEPLDRDKLIEAALHAARFGYGVAIAFSQLTEESVSLYDDAKLEAIWRWNRAHKRLEAQVDDSVFVPHITMLRDGKHVYSSVAWLVDGAILLPHVDVITTIDATAGGASLKFIPVAAIAPLLASVPIRTEGAPHRLVESTPELTAAMQSAKSIVQDPKRLAPDEVLGTAFWAETMAQYQKWSGGKKLVFADDVKPKPKKKKPAKAKPKAKPKAKAKPAAKAKPKPKAKAKAKRNRR